MQFPTQVITEIVVPNNVPLAPGYDVIGIGIQVPAAVAAAGYPAAIMFYSSSYDPNAQVPQIKYQFIADKGGTIYFGYGLVANASVSSAETIVTYEGHGFAGTDAQSLFNYVNATALTAANASIDTLSVNTEIYYQGMTLSSILAGIQAQLAPLTPLGTVAYGNLSSAQLGTVAITTAVKTGLWYINANLVINRTYRMVMSPVVLNYTTSNATAKFYIMYTTDGTIPGLSNGGSTSTFTSSDFTIPQFTQSAQFVLDFTVPVSAAWNFLFAIDNTVTNHPTGINVTLPGSVTVSIEDIGVQVGVGTGAGLNKVYTVAPPAKVQYNVTQLCTSSRSFQGNGTLFNNNDKMYQGQSPYAPNGVQYSDFFFAGTGPNTVNYLNAKGATAANIQTLQLQLTWRHWYYNAGGKMRLGWTNSGTGYATLLTATAVGPAPNLYTIDLRGTLLATHIYAGTFQNFNLGGILGNQCPGGDYNYYGYVDGQGNAAPPKFVAAWQA